MKRKVELRLGGTVLSFFTDEPEEIVNEVFESVSREYEGARKRYRLSDDLEILAHLLVNTTLEKVLLQREIERLRQKYQPRTSLVEEVTKKDEDRAL